MKVNRFLFTCKRFWTNKSISKPGQVVFAFLWYCRSCCCLNSRLAFPLADDTHYV